MLRSGWKLGKWLLCGSRARQGLARRWISHVGGDLAWRGETRLLDPERSHSTGSSNELDGRGRNSVSGALLLGNGADFPKVRLTLQGQPGAQGCLQCAPRAPLLLVFPRFFRAVPDPGTSQPWWVADTCSSKGSCMCTVCILTVCLVCSYRDPSLERMDIKTGTGNL